MARLGRGQPAYQTGHSKLGPPQVVGPVVVYPGPAVTLAPTRDIDDIARLRAPHSRLRPPAVIGPVQTYGPVNVRFAHPRPRWQAKSRLSPPAVLEAPAAVAQTGGIGTSLADARNARSDGRRAPHSRLSPPSAPPVAFITPPVRATRAPSHRPAATHSVLRPPQVVGPVQTYGPVDVELAKVRQSRPVGHTRLSPPTVLAGAFVADPVHVFRTRPHRPAATHSRLFPPTVVGPVQLYEPVDVRFAKVRQARPLGHWRLSPPQVVATAGPTDDTVDVTLAPSRDVARRLPHSKLFAPAVVAPAVVFPSVATTLAPQPRQARAPKSRLQAPTVVTQAFYARAPKVELAPSTRLARRAHARLAAPTVVGPVQLYGPLSSQLAPQPRQGRATHPRLRPPTVVFPFIPPPLAVTLRAIGRELGIRRPVHPELRPPTVITLPTDVVYDEPFDQPTPTGRPGSRPAHADYDSAALGGRTSSRPTSGAFDIPAPIGETDIPDPEI